MAQVEALDEAEHGQYLVESREEIISTMRSMLQFGTQIAAYMDAEDNFLVCSIVGVEEETDSVYLAYDPDSHLAAQLFASKSVCYVGCHRDAKYQFISSQPHAMTHHGRPVLKIGLPKLLWHIQRRDSKRHALRQAAQIKVLLNFPGIGEVEADVADISANGIGIIHYHPDLKLESGLVLDDCEIRLPDQEPIKAKVRIQYSTAVQFTDGQISKRSGCQFLGLSPAAEELLQSYLVALDADV